MKMLGLKPLPPSPSALFNDRKAKILQQLAIPDSDYTDASPKGSVDEAIRPLLDEINATEGFVTTSSCAGRVSVYLEGRRKPANPNLPTGAKSEGASAISSERAAGVGGKGGGGTWLYVSHDPDYPPGAEDRRDKPSLSPDTATATAIGLDEGYWVNKFGLASSRATSSQMLHIHTACCTSNPTRRLIHFKFEPMILHVLTASPLHAQLLLRCALHAGFRESGAVTLTPPIVTSTTSKDAHSSMGNEDEMSQQPAMPVVGVRSMGLGLESIIGYESDENDETSSDNQRESRHMLVSPTYLHMLMQIANERFAENTKRIERFAAAFREASQYSATSGRYKKIHADGTAWEDATVRRERMKAEGLKRQAELTGCKKTEAMTDDATYKMDDLVYS